MTENTTAEDLKNMKQAVSIAVNNVKNGGGPFGAVIILADGTVYEGVNRVTDNNDPTAHAEVTAIRNACAGEGTFTLEGKGAVLYSSCEPCPMCLGASMWSRVDRVVFGANRYDAADAGFDDAEFYELLESGEFGQELPSHPAIKSLVVQPFEAWKTQENRTDY